MKDSRPMPAGFRHIGSESNSALHFDFRTLIDNALDVVSVLDASGTILLQSPSVERHLGYKPEEMVGRKAFDFIHEDDRERVFSSFATGLQEAALALRVPGAV